MSTFNTLRNAFAVLALGLMLGGCSSDDSGTSPSDRPAGMLLDGAVTPPDFENEFSTLFHAVTTLGFPLDTTSQQDSTSIATLIAEKSVLFLPEIEPSFDAGTQTIIADWVEAGGTLVLVGAYRHTTWLNTAFGWSLADEGSFSGRFPMAKLDGASGTPFASGPSSIAGNDGGAYLQLASLPAEGTAIYGGEDGLEAASVAVLTAGAGRIVWFGWDWYDGVPLGLQDGGWYKLLRLTAEF